MPLSIWENILLFLGCYNKAPVSARCFKCKRKQNTNVPIIDLGDEDFICRECWDKWGKP